MSPGRVPVRLSPGIVESYLKAALSLNAELQPLGAPLLRASSGILSVGSKQAHVGQKYEVMDYLGLVPICYLYHRGGGRRRT